ncbi:MAG: hypothetical protein EA417_03270, partial [Gammaproteobacteria bacterium]
MKQPFSISPSRWAAILACPLPMLMACGPATVDPAERGGHWLEMPVEVSCSTPAQFSPDGHRLVFWISESPDPATVPPVTRLGLFDWSSQTSRIPEGLNQRLSLHPGSLCWNEHDGRLHIGGFFATDIRTTRWFQLDPESGSDFRPSNPPTGQCQANPPPLWESHRPVTHTPDIERAVVILSPRETEVVISLQDGAELT